MLAVKRDRTGYLLYRNPPNVGILNVETLSRANNVDYIRILLRFREPRLNTAPLSVNSNSNSNIGRDKLIIK